MRRFYINKMILKTLTLLTVLTSCLSLPLEDGNVPNPLQHEVQPFSPADNQLLDDNMQEPVQHEVQQLSASDNQLLNQLQDPQLQEIPQLDVNVPEQQSPENKPDPDLKTESSHWRGHGYHGHGGRDYGHGHGYGGHGHGYGGYGHGYGGHGYGGYGHGYGGYGNGIGIGYGYPSHRRSFQQSYYPDYDYYYRPRVNPYYYPQNYYIGGSIYW